MMTRTRRGFTVLLMASLATACAAGPDGTRTAPVLDEPGGSVPHHTVVPLTAIPSEQWVQVVSGDPEAPGAPFVIRIHNDPGSTCPPHTHPTDEHIVVVQGTWSVGIGSRIEPDTLQPLDVGDYILVPARSAHFCRSVTETVVQVHGMGPFSIDLVDPLYELSEAGVSVVTSVGGPQQPAGEFRPTASCGPSETAWPVRPARARSLPRTARRRCRSPSTGYSRRTVRDSGLPRRISIVWSERASSRIAARATGADGGLSARTRRSSWSRPAARSARRARRA
jgi:quercetin dioxygenase-like cupin family protein